VSVCPICKNDVVVPAPFRPFCSDRCKKIDLGRWLNEDYRISRPLDEEERQGIDRSEPGRRDEDPLN
jgi:endogenous inhibitor of DNA gyrase (YacG/DUF329 family)